MSNKDKAKRMLDFIINGKYESISPFEHGKRLVYKDKCMFM